MNLNWGKTASAFLGPMLLLAVGLWMAAPHGGFKAPTTAAILPLAPYLVAVPGALMALWFNQGRVVFLLAVLMLTHGTLSALTPGAPGTGADGQVIYAALCVAVPINIVAFSLNAERGLLTTYGLTRAAAILIQAAAITVVSGAGPDARKTAAELLHIRLFAPDFDAWTYITQPGILVFTVAALTMGARSAMTRTNLDGGALGALAASALALHMIDKGGATAVFLTVAALMIVLAVVKDAYRMAFIDELTGLPARRALAAAMKNLNGRYAIAMLDVDHFKKFNDTHGHDVGDQVLQMVASKLGAVTGGGRAFRYGGEEFTVLFPGKTIDEVWNNLEKLRESVAAGRFTLRDKDRPRQKPETPRRRKTGADEIGVNISIGVAEKKAPLSTADAVIRAADKALYKAKENGRNQVSR